MLQYKIPQNVGIEDRIVGPLTLRQLIMVAIGCGFSYVLFAILSKIYELNMIEYIVVALPALISAAMALLKIRDIPLPKFILLTAEFAIKPRGRVWDHRAIVPWIAPDLTEFKTEEKRTEANADHKTGEINLGDLSRILDSGGFDHVEVKTHQDIDKAEDRDLVTEAFFGHKKDKTGNMYWRASKHDRGKRLTLLAKLPPTPVKAAPAVSGVLEKPVAAPIVTPAVTPVVKSAPPAPVAPVAVQGTPTGSLPEAPFKKKRRRRKKKSSSSMGREQTWVNTTQKSQPAQFIPQAKPPAAQPAPFMPKTQTSPSPAKEGEFEFQELQKGEIEINLD